MSNTTHRDVALRKQQWLWIGVAVMILIAGILLVWEAEDTANVNVSDAPSPAPLATVVEVVASEAIASVTAFAELRPRWDTEIRAAVSGRIIEVYDDALEGVRVEVGTPLLTVQKTQYQSALAAAELALEQAKLDHLNAQNHVVVARRQFEREGIEPPNELALRLPQLRIAERALASAEAQLETAQRQLDDTEITAPFSGYVTRRMVSLGQTIAVGEPLLHLSDDARFEAVVELSQADWALLEHPIAGQQVQMFSRNGDDLGRAVVRQGGGFLDQETRQPRIFLEVANSAADVLSGDFVRLDFSGRRMANTLTIPESALSRSGYVWAVSVDDRLERIQPTILFRSGNALTIAKPEGSGPWRIALTPLASFLPGQRVSPQIMKP